MQVLNPMKLLVTFWSLILTVFALTGCDTSETASAPQGGQAPVEAGYRDLNNNGRLDTYEDESAQMVARVADLLSRLTLEQKVRLVSGLGMNMNLDQPGDFETVPGAAGYTYPIDELGIPSIVLADGPAGLRIWPKRTGEERTYYATAFPIETSLASSWDTDLIESVGRAMGDEAKEYGVDVLLAPGMNIHRDPRGGRNFEYYSEDPFLSGHMAGALINGVESVGVGATPKHYVANNQETNRVMVDTIVGERALREIYLRGFEIAVKKSDPWAIMSAYNKVNGIAVSEHRPLLVDVLREEWGFSGVVMTDWFAGYDPVAQMIAGNELLMPGQENRTLQIHEAVLNGDLDEAILDRNVALIIEMVFKSLTFAGYAHSDDPDLKANAKTARVAAAESAVLLKNEKRVLPLTFSTKKIATFGIGSYEFVSGGTGSGDVNESYTVALIDGLTNREYEVDKSLQEIYEPYIAGEKLKLPKKKFFFESVPPLPEMPLGSDLLDGAAVANDIALLTIGRNSGEFQDRGLKGDFYLTEAERAMIDGVSSAFHRAGKKVVVILNIGNVIETASWRGQADAILLPWQGGQEAGNAVVDVLTGDVNPSGKLPTTFPIRYEDVPSSDTFPGVEIPGEEISIAGGLLKAKPSRVEYEDDIFVGYRYYDTFDVSPAYEFGYGLSYTRFEYSDVTIAANGGFSITVTVTNAGAVAGREVIQLYVSAPEGNLVKPAKELKGFAKTSELPPGASETVTFELSSNDLASFHDDRAAWLAEGGEYLVSVGASSRDIRSVASFILEKEVVVADNLIDLSPDTNPERLPSSIRP
jgi:beta-glucosidase